MDSKQLLVFVLVGAFCVVFAQAASLAMPPVVGVENLGRGFDVVSGKAKSPALQFSYVKQKNWYNPHLGQRFSVPDNAYVALSGEVDFDVQVYGSFEAYAAAKAEGVAAGAFKRGAFYEDKGALRWGAFLAAGENVVAFATEKLCLYEVVVVDYNNDSALEEKLLALTDDFNEEQYHNLLREYGTHIVVQVEMGGEVELGVAYKGGVFIEAGGEGVAARAAAKYNSIVYGKEAFAVGEGVKAEGGFELYYSLTAKGGLWEGVEKRDDGWTESVARGPAVIRQKLVPLSELVKHPKHKLHLHNAIQKRLTSAESAFLDKKANGDIDVLKLVHL